MSTTNIKASTIAALAQMIRKDWQQPYFGAVPYIDAMLQLQHIDDKYGADDCRGIITYFLANASKWKGEVARPVKAELNRRLKLKPGEIPLDEALVDKVKPISIRVWNQIAYDVCEAIKADTEEGKKPKPLKNIEAIEASLDANYPTTFCGAEGKEVDQLLDQVFKQHGPDKVLRFLNKHISLDTGVY
jgi:hypothetical protein